MDRIDRNRWKDAPGQVAGGSLPPAAPPLPPRPGTSDAGTQWASMPSTMRAASPVPMPTKRRVWPGAGALVIGAVAAVVAYMLISGGGSGLPDELGGVDRVDSGPMAEMLDGFSDVEFGGVTFDMAVYGGELLPRYMVMAIDGEMPGSDPESLLSTMPSGVVAQDGAEMDFSKAISEQDGATEYVCVPASSTQAQVGFGQEMAVCVYQGQDGSGMVMDLNAGRLRDLLAVTKELVGALG